MVTCSDSCSRSLVSSVASRALLISTANESTAILCITSKPRCMAGTSLWRPRAHPMGPLELPQHPDESAALACRPGSAHYLERTLRLIGHSSLGVRTQVSQIREPMKPIQNLIYRRLAWINPPLALCRSKRVRYIDGRQVGHQCRREKSHDGEICAPVLPGGEVCIHAEPLFCLSASWSESAASATSTCGSLSATERGRLDPARNQRLVAKPGLWVRCGWLRGLPGQRRVIVCF